MGLGPRGRAGAGGRPDWAGTVRAGWSGSKGGPGGGSVLGGAGRGGVTVGRGALDTRRCQCSQWGLHAQTLQLSRSHVDALYGSNGTQAATSTPSQSSELPEPRPGLLVILRSGSEHLKASGGSSPGGRRSCANSQWPLPRPPRRRSASAANAFRRQ